MRPNDFWKDVRFNSTYYNETDFHLLHARNGGDHRLVTNDGARPAYDVAVRVWRYHYHQDPLIVYCEWVNGTCHHLVRRDDTILASGYGSKWDSWQQVRDRLTHLLGEREDEHGQPLYNRA